MFRSAVPIGVRSERNGPVGASRPFMTWSVQLSRFGGAQRNTSQRLPVVFSVDEVRQLLGQVNGVNGLMLKLIYGGGLRVNECCRLRVLAATPNCYKNSHLKLQGSACTFPNWSGSLPTS